MNAKFVTKKVAATELAMREKKSHKNGVSDDQRLLDKLRTIVNILEESSLAELKYEDSDLIVALARHSAAPIALPPLALPAVPSIAALPATMASPPATPTNAVPPAAPTS